MLRKQQSQTRRTQFKTTSLARSLSPQGGKLLILRPTLPFHHTDAVSVQRIRLQYEIDVVPQRNVSLRRYQSATVRAGGSMINVPSASAKSTSQTSAAHKQQRKDQSTR